VHVQEHKIFGHLFGPHLIGMGQFAITTYYGVTFGLWDKI